MAVGISRSIGIGMKKCCGGTVSGGGGGGGGSTTFPLYLATLNPAPTDCSEFSIYVRVNGVAKMTMVKTSGSPATFPMPSPVQITAGDIVQVTIESRPPSTVQCQYDPGTQTGYTWTDVTLNINGTQGGTVYTNTYTSSSGQIALYQYTYTPVQGVSDLIAAYGTPMV